jgi:hypothetical protein
MRWQFSGAPFELERNRVLQPFEWMNVCNSDHFADDERRGDVTSKDGLRLNYRGSPSKIAGLPRIYLESPISTSAASNISVPREIKSTSYLSRFRICQSLRHLREAILYPTLTGTMAQGAVKNPHKITAKKSVLPSPPCQPPLTNLTSQSQILRPQNR